MDSWEEACRKECEYLAQTLIKKQMDYGKDNINDFGEEGIIVRSSDKFSRIKHLNKETKQPANESINDTWLDIAGYAILARMYRMGTFDLPFGGENSKSSKNTASILLYIAFFGLGVMVASIALFILGGN